MPILGNVIPPSNALTPTTVTATGKVTAGAKLDMNGTEIILDADADTSITADTDDQIDIRIAGADDFRFTANTLSVLSGSTLNIDSGATIANSGTATGFGPSVAAAAGIMEANANFVDAVIFGPAMDPVGYRGRYGRLKSVEHLGFDLYDHCRCDTTLYRNDWSSCHQHHRSYGIRYGGYAGSAILLRSA